MGAEPGGHGARSKDRVGGQPMLSRTDMDRVRSHERLRRRRQNTQKSEKEQVRRKKVSTTKSTEPQTLRTEIRPLD